MRSGICERTKPCARDSHTAETCSPAATSSPGEATRVDADGETVGAEVVHTISATQRCSGGDWGRLASGGFAYAPQLPNGEWDAAACRTMLAGDDSCSTEWFTVASNNGACWCVPAGSDCAVLENYGYTFGTYHVTTASTPGLVDVPEALRIYENTWQNVPPGGELARSSLESVAAWCAVSTTVPGWLQMDLGSSRYVAQIVTRGRADSTATQWVTQYKVQHSTDGITFTEVPALFTGNSDKNTKVYATLPEPVLARYVRLVPTAWSIHACMRAAVIVAPPCREPEPEPEPPEPEPAPQPEPEPVVIPTQMVECQATLVPFSSRYTGDMACTGTEGDVCEYICSLGYEDMGDGFIICLPDGQFSDTAGCESSTADTGGTVSTTATVAVTSTIAATTAASVSTSVGTSAAASAGASAGGAGVSAGVSSGAGGAAGGAGGAGGGAGAGSGGAKFQGGDPLSLLFAVQFVAISGQIASPLGPVYRDFASSFAWANLQLDPPFFLKTADVNKYAIKGRNSLAERMREYKANSNWGRRMQAANATSYIDEASKEYLSTLGNTAADVFVGNLFYAVMIPLFLGIAHAGFFACVKAVIDSQIKSFKAATEALSSAQNRQDTPLPADMMPPMPQPFEVPAELSFSKLLVTIFLAAHMGLCQSSLNAMFAKDTPAGIFMLAVATFLLFPVGFIVYSTLTVRGVVGAGTLKWGRLLFSIPKDFEHGDLEFKPYLPRLSKSEAKKKAIQAGGEIAGGTSTSQKKLYANIKKTLAAGNVTDAIRMQGYWEASTTAANRILVIYGGLFSKATDLGYVFMCIEMSKKLLQICLLTLLDGEHAEAQLILLQVLTAAQLAFVLRKQVYNERIRNFVEPLIMLAQYCVFLVPLLFMLERYDEHTATVGMMGASAASVAIALLKELSSTVPTVLAQLTKLLSGSSNDDKSNSRRNMSGMLTKLNALPGGPQVLQYAASAIDEETQALIQTTVQKATTMLEQYTDGASESAKKWMKKTGDEIIQQAREHGEVDKVVPPVELFHRDGLIDVAEGSLKEELLKLDSSKDVKKLVKSQALNKKDPIAETKRKFSELCEEYVLVLVRPELQPAVSGNVDALEIPAEVPVKKQDIKEFAIDLCETYARKHVHEQFIKAYNKAEEKVITLCGVGTASDDPESGSDELRYSNPLAEAADDMQDKAVGKAEEKVDEEGAKAKKKNKKKKK